MSEVNSVKIHERQIQPGKIAPRQIFPYDFPYFDQVENTIADFFPESATEKFQCAFEQVSVLRRGRHVVLPCIAFESWLVVVLSEDFADEDRFLAAVDIGDKGRKAFKSEVGLVLGIGLHGNAEKVDIMHRRKIIAEVVVDKTVFRIVIAVEDSENIHRAGEDVFGYLRNIVADGKQQGGDLRQTGASFVA